MEKKDERILHCMWTRLFILRWVNPFEMLTILPESWWQNRWHRQVWRSIIRILSKVRYLTLNLTEMTSPASSINHFINHFMIDPLPHDFMIAVTFNESLFWSPNWLIGLLFFKLIRCFLTEYVAFKYVLFLHPAWVLNNKYLNCNLFV